jgi:hypothetical protein
LIYKLISKIIANHLKGCLSEIILEEQFGFLFNRQIHNVVAISQEELHSLKTSKVLAFVIKINLAKSYDKVNWTFIRLTLLQLGMNLQMVNWIMGCIQSVSFVVLLNGSPSSFFTTSKSLRQGCLLSPFIFLLVVKGLSLLIKGARQRGVLKGIKVSNSMNIMHHLFVDDVLLFGDGTSQELRSLRTILDLYYKAIGMELNLRKSCMLSNCVPVDVSNQIKDIMPITCIEFEQAFEYLGFT